MGSDCLAFRRCSHDNTATLMINRVECKENSHDNKLAEVANLKVSNYCACMFLKFQDYVRQNRGKRCFTQLKLSQRTTKSK